MTSFSSFAPTSSPAVFPRPRDIDGPDQDGRDQHFTFERDSPTHRRPYAVVLENFSGSQLCFRPAFYLDPSRQRRTAGLFGFAQPTAGTGEAAPRVEYLLPPVFRS